MSKTQQRFKSKRHVFTEEINIIVSIEANAYITSKDLVSEKERLNVTI